MPESPYAAKQLERMAESLESLAKLVRGSLKQGEGAHACAPAPIQLAIDPTLDDRMGRLIRDLQSGPMSVQYARWRALAFLLDLLAEVTADGLLDNEPSRDRIKGAFGQLGWEIGLD